MSGPGLAGPRTTLAWDRTALSAAGLGALLLKFGIDRGIVVEMIAGVAALLAAGVLAFGLPHKRMSHREMASRASSGGSPLVVAGLILIAAVLTVVTVTSYR
ncbi:MAG: DUF202 domain-containing protein [Jatrophihabitans sp.]